MILALINQFIEKDRQSFWLSINEHWRALSLSLCFCPCSALTLFCSPHTEPTPSPFTYTHSHIHSLLSFGLLIYSYNICPSMLTELSRLTHILTIQHSHDLVNASQSSNFNSLPVTNLYNPVPAVSAHTNSWNVEYTDNTPNVQYLDNIPGKYRKNSLHYSNFYLGEILCMHPTSISERINWIETTLSVNHFVVELKWVLPHWGK